MNHSKFHCHGMSDSLDITMQSNRQNRNSGGFNSGNRPINGRWSRENRDERLQDRMDKNLGFGKKTQFKKNHQLRHSGKERGANMVQGLNEMLNENIRVSVGTLGDPRRVAIAHSGRKIIARGDIASVHRKSDQNALSNPSHGYKIQIPYGVKFQKDYLLNSLHNLIAPDTFVPIMYQESGHTVVFWVDDKRASEKLRDCDEMMISDDNYKLKVYVKPGFPRYEFDETLREQMKKAIEKKFVSDRNALDMSRFHHNPDLVDDYYCSLTRSPIIATALKIVTTTIPNLVEISLDDNQLYSLDKLKMLEKLPCLKILGICNNRINDLDQLDAIKDLKLDELRLAGNPVSQKYIQRRDDYVSGIREKFPGLLRLDGSLLQTVISFELEEDRFVVPPSQRMFAPSDEARVIAAEFLRQYFQVFDSDNRQPLLNAYDENASFSMTVLLPYNDNNSETYFSNSRNLCKVLEETKRRKLLKQGRLPVVAHISELPRMQHDLDSFTMDIGLVTERMMLVTVTGIFRELVTASQPVRYFTRTFIIVPKGGGYCIINEMLQIAKPTKKQESEAFPSTTSIECEQTGMTTTTETTMGTMASVTTIANDAKTQMTLALRERTKMTLEWTLKCLNDVQWDFNTALSAFQTCHSRGEIPLEAFEK